MKKIQSLYFSATGTTRRIVTTVEAHSGLPAVRSIDLTLPASRAAFQGNVDGDVMLVAAPVYHGTIPLPMMDPLGKLEGAGKWAVPIAVFGNRSPETCVEELAELLRSRGFKILAAASFAAEHSMCTMEHPWGLGRPDETDLATAAEFGEKIGKKLVAEPSEVQTGKQLFDFLASAYTNFSSRVMADSLSEGYHENLSHWIKASTTISFSRESECTECMLCSESCPTGAMDVGSKSVIEDLCIRCMACIHTCSRGAIALQSFDSPMAVAVQRSVDQACAVRKEPSILL